MAMCAMCGAEPGESHVLPACSSLWLGLINIHSTANGRMKDRIYNTEYRAIIQHFNTVGLSIHESSNLPCFVITFILTIVTYIIIK